MNDSLLDQLKAPAFESVVAELFAQDQKLLDVQRQAFKNLDYVAKIQDDLNEVRSFAVEMKRLSNVVDTDAIRRFSENISSLKIDKGYFVTTATFSETARRFAQQHHQTLELIDRKSLRDLLSQYEVKHALFSESLFQKLNQLKSQTLIDIPYPTSENLERLHPEETGLSDPLRESLVVVDSLPLKLISRILRAPEEVRNLTPRQFEEFVAETLDALGFRNVILTPRSHDGGKDVIASHEINGIPLSFYFECKKYSDGNKIQLETLRTLLGTVAHDARSVNKGVLVTTSSFTSGAKGFILSEARLDGKDYDGILGWINELKKEI